jgi:hypothetical protein
MAKMRKNSTERCVTSAVSPTVNVCVAMTCGANTVARTDSTPSTTMVRLSRLLAKRLPPSGAELLLLKQVDRDEGRAEQTAGHELVHHVGHVVGDLVGRGEQPVSERERHGPRADEARRARAERRDRHEHRRLGHLFAGVGRRRIHLRVVACHSVRGMLAGGRLDAFAIRLRSGARLRLRVFRDGCRMLGRMAFALRAPGRIRCGHSVRRCVLSDMFCLFRSGQGSV